MLRSDSGMARTVEGELPQFEGLVIKTAAMYSRIVGIDEEDMQQLLRIKAWQAINAYNPQRSRMTLKTYVFGCIRNRVKDMLRDSQRARMRGGECYIEDQIDTASEHPRQDDWTRSHFEAQYLVEPREQVYASVEEDFELPSWLTEQEKQVVILLALDYAHREIAVVLGISIGAVTKIRNVVREKMADFKPETTAGRDERIPIAA